MTRTGCARSRQSVLSPLRLTGAILAAWAVLALAGCAAVGPDYTPPENKAPVSWHTGLREGLVADSLDPQVLARWWTTLEDPILAGLINQAVNNNLDLRLATSRVREARARRGLNQAGQFPVLDATGSAGRSKSSGNGATRDFHALNIDAGWEVDIFGGARRAVEAADADLAASQEDLRDVLVTLTAEVALNYLEVRTLQARLAIATSNLNIQQQTFDLTQSSSQAGLSDELALQQARANLESTRAQLPGLRGSLEETKNRLAVLAGKIPGEMHDLLATVQPLPVVPPTVAVGVPAETLRQRPDIRRAERDLAARTARIGVATADLYPKFRLTGTIGLEALRSAELFNGASGVWRIGPGVSWNLFDAGAIRQNIEVQSAIQEQYLLAYEATVLAALAEVENALTVYAEEQLRRQGLLTAVTAAREAEALSRNLYQAGLTDFTTVLDAQRSQLSLEDQLAQSNGTVTANLVRLYKALGGGWHPSMLPATQPGAEQG